MTHTDECLKAQAERDAAVAEAAALREAASAWMADNQCSQLPQEQVGCICAFCRFKSALSQPGPGAALLEQFRTTRSLLRETAESAMEFDLSKDEQEDLERRIIALLSAAPPAGGGGKE